MGYAGPQSHATHVPKRSTRFRMGGAWLAARVCGTLRMNCSRKFCFREFGHG